MADFGPPKGTPTVVLPKQRDPKAESLGLFKSLLIKLSQKTDSLDTLAMFTKHPTPINYGFQTVDGVRDVLFTQIQKFTNIEERKKILEELYDAAELQGLK